MNRPGNLEDIIDVFEDNDKFKILSNLISEDVARDKKESHWVWYLYPQELNPNHKYNYEIALGESVETLMHKFPVKYGVLLAVVDSRGVTKKDWWDDRDKPRVNAFRENNCAMMMFLHGKRDRWLVKYPDRPLEGIIEEENWWEDEDLRLYWAPDKYNRDVKDLLDLAPFMLNALDNGNLKDLSPGAKRFAMENPIGEVAEDLTPNMVGGSRNDLAKKMKKIERTHSRDRVEQGNRVPIGDSGKTLRSEIIPYSQLSASKPADRQLKTWALYADFERGIGEINAMPKPRDADDVKVVLHNPNGFACLLRLASRDLLDTKMARAWIWYVYPSEDMDNPYSILDAAGLCKSTDSGTITLLRDCIRHKPDQWFGGDALERKNAWEGKTVDVVSFFKRSRSRKGSPAFVAQDQQKTIYTLGQIKSLKEKALPDSLRRMRDRMLDWPNRHRTEDTVGISRDWAGHDSTESKSPEQKIRDWAGIVETENSKVPAVTKPKLEFLYGINIATDGNIWRDSQNTAIVNAANGYLDHGSGIAEAISEAGGDDLKNADKQVLDPNKGSAIALMRDSKNNYYIPVGQAVVLDPQTKDHFGTISVRFVIHAIVPKFKGTKKKDGTREKLTSNEVKVKKEELKKAYQSVIRQAQLNGIKNVVFCVFSSGKFKGDVPMHEIVKIAVDTLRDDETYAQSSFPIEHVALVGFNDEVNAEMKKLESSQ